jgi:tRNA pseudouridine55 synthase
MYSALKRDGRPLYELARRGEEVERAPRDIRIDRIELVACEAGTLEFEVVCSKGTYIRVLGEEIASRLGTVGHLTALRRLWVEPFEAEPMVTLGTLEKWSEEGGWVTGPPPGVLPVDRAFPALPRLDLDAAGSLHLRQGRVLDCAATPLAATGLLRAYDGSGTFLGLVEADEERQVRVRRLFVPGDQGDGGASP